MLEYNTLGIKRIPICKLNPAAYNPRKDLQIQDEEYKKLERSIEEFGYIDPIIWNEQTGNVVGGHQRLKILANKGYTAIEVSVVNLGEDREKQLNIALNKISGEWDQLALEEIINELYDKGLDTTLTGFDEREIERMVKDAEELIQNGEEVELQDYTDEQFKCECPKCGFMFNVKE